jgi:16S rRNA (guanine966-N2)-methyltransferase
MTIRIYGNRAIATLPGDRTRPTASRVRESLFNIWRGQVVGARWLDICAGSGAMGAEALCRGAVSAVAIEQSNRACQLIEANWNKVKRSEQTIRVVRGDATRSLATLAGESFDAIYFDPPYASPLYQPVLDAITRFHLLAEGGEIAVEHDRDRCDVFSDFLASEAIATPQQSKPQEPGTMPEPDLECYRTKIYGRTAISLFRHSRP